MILSYSQIRKRYELETVIEHVIDYCHVNYIRIE